MDNYLAAIKILSRVAAGKSVLVLLGSDRERAELFRNLGTLSEAVDISDSTDHKISFSPPVWTVKCGEGRAQLISAKSKRDMTHRTRGHRVRDIFVSTHYRGNVPERLLLQAEPVFFGEA